MTDITEQDILDAMRLYGGSFVSHLSRAAQCADPENYARLKAAFPALWVKYRGVARQIAYNRARDAEVR